MKKLLIAVLLFAVAKVDAQNFEGTIKWTMKMDITDPKLKGEMSDAQKQLNDPATQAKMKELKDKMNDPQMKALMEANPQMKEMMEKQLKAAQGGGKDMMNNMMPKGMLVKIKDGNSLVQMDGGMMKGEILHLKDKSYHIDRENKTYSVLSSSSDQPTQTNKPTVTKTPETAKIAGYTCTKYIVTSQEYGQTMTSSVWATTEISGIDTKALAKRSAGRTTSFFYEGVDGIPLKVESQTPQGKITMEATEVKKQPQNAADFTVPSDYKETQGFFGK